MMTSDERRSKTRRDIEIEVDLGTYDKYYLSKLENISIGGAFVRTKQLHPVGTDVRLRFRLPNQIEPIMAQGEVVWTYRQPSTVQVPNSSGMGIRFTKIEDEDQKKIAHYINTTTKR